MLVCRTNMQYFTVTEFIARNRFNYLIYMQQKLRNPRRFLVIEWACCEIQVRICDEAIIMDVVETTNHTI